VIPGASSFVLMPSENCVAQNRASSEFLAVWRIWDNLRPNVDYNDFFRRKSETFSHYLRDWTNGKAMEACHWLLEFGMFLDMFKLF